jgi:hypothetical protein
MADDATDTLDDREPCPDDLCTGIIGENGRCGVCGRKREGPPPKKEGRSISSASSGRPYPDSDDDFPETEEAEGETRDEDGDEGVSSGDEERIPCPDDLCTGIIGPNGRCGVCGRKP